MNDIDKFESLISTLFSGTQPDGYDVKDYYGVMLMKIKRTGRYQIRLQYDYKNRNMINGKPVEFDSLKAVVKAFVLLEKFSKRSEKSKKQREVEEMLLA